MPDFEYTARTQDGQAKKGRIKMENEKKLADYLKGQGLILTSSKRLDKKEGKSLQGFLDKLSKVPVVEKIFFTQNLSIMVKTGFPLAQALQTLEQQTEHKFFKKIISELKHDIESGISFSNALKKHPRHFSELFINMISAGEVSGKLDEVLTNLTTQMKKDHTIKSKVKNAMMYPAVIVLAMVAIGTLLMITVIPQLVGIFEETGADLPITTKALIFVSDTLQNQGIYLLILAAIAGVGFQRARKTDKGKKVIHRILLKLPAFGGIIKKVNNARFTRTLSSLLATDIPIVQTLQIIAKTLSNVHYRAAIIDASEKVKKGVSIVKTLEAYPDLFPPIVTQMINIGEESGTLDSITNEIADFYEEDVEQTMEGLSSIIEPILMLVIGGVVMVVALSVLQPMYGLVETI